MATTMPTGPLLALALLAACGGADPDPPPPILVGILTPMTGDLAAYGVDVHAGTILAADEINQAGGIDGRLLQLEASDDGTSNEGSRVAYSNLLRLDVAAVIGPGHSAGANAMADEIRNGRTLTISGSTTAASLATLDDGGYFFRTVPGDDKQGQVLVSLIRGAQVQSLCLVHRIDAYGSGLAAVVKTAFETELTLRVASYDPAQATLDHVLDACEDIEDGPGPGIAFITFEGDGKLVMNDAIRRGWRRPKAQVFLVDGNRNQRLYDELDDKSAFAGCLGTSPGGPELTTEAGVRLGAFRQSFSQRWRRQPGVHAETNYDAMYLAAAALALAGPDAPGEEVRAAMPRTRAGAFADAGDWSAIADSIASDGTVDVRGASGAIDLDPVSGELQPPYYISVWSLSEEGLIVDRRVEVIEE